MRHTNIINWIRNRFRGIQRKTTPHGTIEKEFGVQPAVSRLMEDNINLWYAMYINHPPWETRDVRPLGLPAAIGRELASHALTEFEVTVSGSQRADYINEIVQAAKDDFQGELELGLCLSGIALKPYIEGDRLLIDATTVTAFAPTEFDGTGRVIGGVFKSKPIRQDKKWYIKLEYHNFAYQDDGSKIYTIQNKAFESSEDGSTGAEVELSVVDKWAKLQPEQTIANLEKPLFAYFKPPSANNVETDSDMGISVYAGSTVDLIKQADEKWEKIEWEYQSGERKIYAEDEAIKRPSDVLNRLFVYGDFSATGDFFQEFSPEFRDDPLYRGFQRILQRIEFNVGMSYGTISDPQTVEKTATEILAAKHRQYVTEGAIQTAFQSTLEDLIYAIDAWCDLAGLATAGEYTVDYKWGDGVLDDPDQRRQDMAMDMQRVAAGLMRHVDFVMKWDKVDEETARKMLPDMEELVTEPQFETE